MALFNENSRDLNTIKEKIQDLLLDYFKNKDKDVVRILEVEPAKDNILMLLLSKGYKKLFGIGATESIYNLPSYHYIKYTYGNPQKTHFPNNFFDFIISINLSQTNNVTLFISEMTRIISDNGVLVLRSSNNSDSLSVSSNIGNNLELISSFPVSENGPKNLCIMKSTKTTNQNHIDDIFIIHPHLGMNDSHYCLHLRDKFINDGMNACVVKSEVEVPENAIKIFELESGQYFRLPLDHNCIIETHSIVISSKSLKTKIKVAALRGLAVFFNKYRKLERKYIEMLTWEKYYKDNIKQYKNLLLRSNEFGDYLGVDRYALMPHISYGVHIKDGDRISELKIGSFGAAKRYKHFEKICGLGIRLNIPVIVVATIVNEPLAKEESEKTAKWLVNKFKNFKNIQIITGYFTDEEIAEKLSSCTHLIFDQEEGRFWTSGSMRFAAALGKPVIAKDSWQAKEAQVIRVKRIDDITIDFLETHKDPPIIQDGYEYLRNYLLFQYNIE